MKCQNCGSTELHHKESDLEHVKKSAKHGAVHGMAHRNPAWIAVAAVGWLTAKAMHAMQETWTCKLCGYKFS